MKKNLTFLIIGILAAIGAVIMSCTPVSANGKKGHLRYFYYEVKFTSSDGCNHTNWGKFTSDKPDISADFDFILRAIKKYVAPYSVDLKTFHITEYKIISKKEWLAYKANRFNPCNSNPPGFKSTISYKGCDTCLFISNPNTTIWHTAALVAFGNNTELLHISVPDSTQTYTVSFAKSKVHFINDSTFTFKVNK